MLKICAFGIILWGFGLQASDFRAFFEASEHVLAGDEVILPGVASRLKLENGLQMSFGELVAMGDFYGVVGSPIIEGHNKADQKSRFLKVFDSLASKPESVQEAKNIVAAIRENIAMGKPTDDMLEEAALDRAQKWSCLTGGGCNRLTWWSYPGRYVLLAKKNYDHFGKNSLIAYVAGHETALEEAVLAAKNKDLSKLMQAYAMDAFACHFLTDPFSSGHIRTPRVELPDNVTPAGVGSLLAGMMHNEENKYGLHVHNQQGEKWVAYGDGFYLDPLNSDNRRMIHQAIQSSVDEIYEAYQNGKMPENHAALKLVPEADESNSEGRVDLAPLFYWDKENMKLIRRADLSDPFDYHWISNWFGLPTLTELQMLKGNHSDSTNDDRLDDFL